MRWRGVAASLSGSEFVDLVDTWSTVGSIAFSLKKNFLRVLVVELDPTVWDRERYPRAAFSGSLGPLPRSS